MVAYPVWLGDPSRPALGWWHCPADHLARAGIVLCPPLGFDYLQSYRALRVLADELGRCGLLRRAFRLRRHRRFRRRTLRCQARGVDCDRTIGHCVAPPKTEWRIFA